MNKLYTMALICPNCGSNEIGYTRSTTLDDAYDATDQRYTCSACGYTGSVAIEREREETVSTGFPYTEIFVFFFLAALWYLLGAGMEFSALFFTVPSAIIVLFRYLLGGGHPYSVEDDLLNLDENGLPKKS